MTRLRARQRPRQQSMLSLFLSYRSERTFMRMYSMKTAPLREQCFWTVKRSGRRPTSSAREAAVRRHSCPVAASILMKLTIHPLLELMPPVLLLQGSTAGDTMLPTLLHAMADEVMEQRVGAATVLARLADVVITRLGCDSGPKDWQRLGCYPPSSG